MSQVLSVDLQQRALECMIKEMAPSLLFACGSNHEAHYQKQCGFSYERKLMEQAGVTWFEGHAHTRLIVGDVEYTILANHSPKGKSINNPCYGLLKMWRQCPADIVMAGHVHTPAMAFDLAMQLACEAGMPFGGERALLLCGTANTDADYARRHYGAGGAAIWPCVVLYPDRKKIVPFWTLQAAIAYCEGIKHERLRRKARAA
jgi:hypothetical protein